MLTIALVGMAGAGKSEAACIFENQGFTRIRFGDITDIEIKKRGLVLNEKNEKATREALRDEYGMAAYAILNRPRIDEALAGAHVVIDGLYSWEEFKSLKQKYGASLITVAVLTSPATRHKRLGLRAVRTLIAEEALSRDSAEIENLNKGGPIAMADYNIINETSLEDLASAIKSIIGKMGAAF